MAYLHSEPNVIVHRDLKPRLVGGFMSLLLGLQEKLVLTVCINSCSLSLYDDECGVSLGTFYL